MELWSRVCFSELVDGLLYSIEAITVKDSIKML